MATAEAGARPCTFCAPPPGSPCLIISWIFAENTVGLDRACPSWMDVTRGLRSDSRRSDGSRPSSPATSPGHRCLNNSFTAYGTSLCSSSSSARVTFSLLLEEVDALGASQENSVLCVSLRLFSLGLQALVDMRVATTTARTMCGRITASAIRVLVLTRLWKRWRWATSRVGSRFRISCMHVKRMYCALEPGCSPAASRRYNTEETADDTMATCKA